MSEEDRKREAVRAQLEQVTQEYKAAQEQAHSAAQQLKCVSAPITALCESCTHRHSYDGVFPCTIARRGTAGLIVMTLVGADLVA